MGRSSKRRKGRRKEPDSTKEAAKVHATEVGKEAVAAPAPEPASESMKEVTQPSADVVDPVAAPMVPPAAQPVTHKEGADEADHEGDFVLLEEVPDPEPAAPAHAAQTLSRARAQGVAVKFALVVPVYNEQDNVEALLEEVVEVLASERPFEVLMVDDGSTDGTAQRLASWKAAHDADWLRIVRLHENSGQSAAVLAGARRARAPVVVTMDGDMQNDPRDLLRILTLMRKGPRVGVVGVRRKRQDSFVRRASSKVGNTVRNWITGDRVTDAACGIKGFRREVFVDAPAFHGMHRFMATLARYQGEEVVEIEVNHRPRRAGVAKYGIGNRALRGLRDCFAVRWLRDRSLRPAACDEI